MRRAREGGLGTKFWSNTLPSAQVWANGIAPGRPKQEETRTMTAHNAPAYWLGTDEAGYGARLGPLVVTATCWELMPSIGQALSSALESLEVLENCSQAEGEGSRTDLQIRDSKKLFQAGKSLDGLQRVVDAFLLAIDRNSQPPVSLFQLLQQVTDSESSFDAASFQPYWFRADDHWPVLDSERRDKDCQQLLTGEVVPWKVCSHAVDEQRFNDGLKSAGNKANFLSQITLQLVQRVLEVLPEAATIVVDLDRHGGRKRYLPLLLTAMKADWMTVVVETPEESVYRWDRPEGVVWFRFSVNGERRMPVAVASMFSKLLRERSMNCFNEYWAEQDSQLKRTAGYPVDAARFQRDTHQLRGNAKLSDEQFWRNA